MPENSPGVVGTDSRKDRSAGEFAGIELHEKCLILFGGYVRTQSSSASIWPANIFASHGEPLLAALFPKFTSPPRASFVMTTPQLRTRPTVL